MRRRRGPVAACSRPARGGDVAGCVGRAGAGADRARRRTAGRRKSLKTEALVVGARALQGNSPLAPMDIQLVGLHPTKDDPQHQMEAHHYCAEVNEDFAQCVLFDGNGKGANLNSIEYIISSKLFGRLPEAERQFWHPHNYEILSGQLIGPGLPAVAEHALMKGKINSYGKTWHVWSNGTRGGGSCERKDSCRLTATPYSSGKGSRRYHQTEAKIISKGSTRP